MRKRVGKSTYMRRPLAPGETLKARTKRVDGAATGEKQNRGNLNNHPAAKKPTFTNTLIKLLTQKKKFRRPDGSLMESTELELIALKVIRELRSSTPMSSKMLDIVLTRIEGKPKDVVEIDGKLELAKGLDARDILLQRLDRILSDGEEASEEETQEEE